MTIIDGHPTDKSDGENRPISGAAMDRVLPSRVRSRRVRRGVVAVVLAAALVGLWAMQLAGNTGPTVAAASLEVHQVVLGEFADEVPVRGQVTPQRSTYVETSIAGTVDQVFVEDGAAVSASQPLLRLRDHALELQTSEREAALLQQLGSIQESLSQLERDQRMAADQLAEVAHRAQAAKSELLKQQLLNKEGFISDILLERFEAESRFLDERWQTLRTAKSRSDTADAQRTEQLRALARRIEQTLQATRGVLSALELRAPEAGVLTGLAAKPGQRLEIGTRVAQIDSTTGAKVTGLVDEFYLPRVAVGQRAHALINGVPGPELVVAKMLPQVVAGRFSLDLEFVREIPVGLRRGQTIETRLTLSSPAAALLLPVGAFLADSGGGFVFKVDEGGGTALRVPVGLGRRNGRWTEVLNGVRAGDRVITSSYADFKQHPQIRIQ